MKTNYTEEETHQVVEIAKKAWKVIQDETDNPKVAVGAVYTLDDAATKALAEMMRQEDP